MIISTLNDITHKSNNTTMTWEEKIYEINKILEDSRILNCDRGLVIFDTGSPNAERAIIQGNLNVAEKYLEENKNYFEAYKKAYKLYKRYTGAKELVGISHYASSFIKFEYGVLKLAVPRSLPIDKYLLKVSRLYAHYKERIAKHPKNMEV